MITDEGESAGSLRGFTHSQLQFRYGTRAASVVSVSDSGDNSSIGKHFSTLKIIA